MRIRLLYYGLLLLSLPVTAQNRLTTIYNAGNGLPSNNVYETLIDQQGFLWAATDNGLCRFDGTRFTVYTTTHGLPENEVPDIDMDSAGTVWGLPFIKTPVYFNSEKGRFENELTDTLLAKIQPGSVNSIFTLSGGGVAVSGRDNRIYIIKNRRLQQTLIPPIPRGNIRMICETAPGRILILGGHYMVLCENGVITRTRTMQVTTAPGKIAFYRDHLYIAAGNSIHSFACHEGWPADTATVTTFEFPVFYFGNTRKHFYIVSPNGNAYLLDHASLSLIPNSNIYNGADIIGILEDDNGNIWISTHDAGLLRLQPRRIGPYDWPAAMNANFNALAWHGDKIMAGNNKGEVTILTLPFNVQVLQLSAERRFSAWVRKIIPFSNAVYVATQGGDFWLRLQSNGRYTSSPANYGLAGGAKTALRINDSLLVTGSHAMASLWNIATGRLQDTVQKRVTALGNIGNRVFVGSTDGLYEWRQRELVKPEGWQPSGLQYRITALCGTADSLLWVGLSADSLLVWGRNKIVAAIPLGKDMPGNTCKALYSNQPGTIWLGTDKGLASIRYRLSNNKLVYTTAWFGRADGLANENVNDITIHNDTVYVATAGGISYLPARLPQTLNEIPVIINNVVAAGKSQGAVSYIRLPYGQGNIRIEYSGIDLSGYTPRFAYRVNNGPWQSIVQDFIELQFSPGSYNIEIAAIKRNGEPSAKTTRLTVVMKTPYWKTSWFWFGVLILVLFIIFWMVLRNNRRKRLVAEEKLTAEKKLAELEMQALRAQINPHFVFNCLNSIKGFIHEHDFMQADRYLDAFSVLLRNTLENSIDGYITLQQETEYLHNYLELEQLRFNHQFIYAINTEALPKTSGILIPAMLIQPYVENAIRHGIRHLQNKQGYIGVTFRMSGLSIECTIEDNGVGRQQGAAMKSAQHIEYQGRGMQISQRRAQLYQATVTVTDRTHPDGTAAGTTVTIITPLVKR